MLRTVYSEVFGGVGRKGVKTTLNTPRSKIFYNSADANSEASSSRMDDNSTE